MNVDMWVLCKRALIIFVFVSPLVVVLVVGVQGGISSSFHSSFVTLREHVSDLRQGRVSEGTVLCLCVLVMFGSWIRFTWVMTVVLVTRWRGRETRHVDRPLVRLVLRFLVLTPIAAQAMTSSVDAHVSGAVVDRELEVESTPLVRDVLLVSIAVAAGVVWRVRQERASALRNSTGSDSISWTSRDLEGQAFESVVVRSGDDSALVRLGSAVRSLVHGGVTDFVWLIRHPTGVIHVLSSASCGPCPGWTRVSDRMLALDVDAVPLHSLANGWEIDVRIPIMIPVGTTEAGEVWVNLESAGDFFVEGGGSDADAVWAGLCQSVSLSPLHTSAHLISACDAPLYGRRHLVVENAELAYQVADVLHRDESPAVRLTAQGDRRTLSAGTGRSGVNELCGLVRQDERWLLVPMHQPIAPTRCDPGDIEKIIELIGESGRPLRHVSSAQRARHQATGIPTHVRSILDETSFLVRVLGHPKIEHIDGGEVSFERSRSLELVVWLSLHPHRRRRSAARADMWNVAIKDATFSNITSDVRRSLTAWELPAEGEQWLSVTLTDDLPLHPRVITDVSILRSCFEHARRCPEDAGGTTLAFALDYVRGCPLEGSGYLWRDATGITTEMSMLIVRSAMLCADMARAAGDSETLYRASAKGLLAVPGHEDLVAARMRQHADNADTASLIAEWESYCRALMSDDWGDARPSQKMVDLWRSLANRNHIDD